MKNILLLCTILMLASCVDSVVKHEGGEVVWHEAGYASTEIASYPVARLNDYPMLKKEGLEERVKVLNGFIFDCKGGQRSQSVVRFDSVFIFSSGENINLGYKPEYKCTINIAKVNVFLAEKNKTIIDRVNEQKKQEKEKAEYRKSVKFADHVIEEIGIYRAESFLCSRYGPSFTKNIKSYNDRATAYTKDLLKGNYSNKKMIKSLADAFALFKAGHRRVNYDYCQAIKYWSDYSGFEWAGEP